jgi:hypothetical protein
MSWLFSQALVEAFSEANSLDGEQFVPSSGNLTPQAYLSPDKMTDFSRLSRFGMTFKPLTENLGAAVLMWCQEDSLAKTYQGQEKEQASTESAQGCGEKWRASFTKYDPDMRSWKTHQCSLLGDLEPFLETWPQWGLMRDGECWEQVTLERLTRGTGYGLLPTPCARDGSGARSLQALKKANRGETNSLPDYFRVLKNWQYPPVAAVEYMMGWLVGWTDLKPLETDKSPCVPQEHGKS